MLQLSILFTALFFWAVAAFAVEQVTRILIHGSIFEPMREWIADRATRTEDFCSRERGASWFDVKLHELFSCNFCLVNHVAFWFIAMPFTAWLVYIRTFVPNSIGGIIVTVLLCLWILTAVTFAVASVASHIWNMRDFGPKTVRELKAAHQREVEELERRNLVLRAWYEQLGNDHHGLINEVAGALASAMSPAAQIFSIIGMGGGSPFPGAPYPGVGRERHSSASATATVSVLPTARLTENQFNEILLNVGLCTKYGCPDVQEHCVMDQVQQFVRALREGGQLAQNTDIQVLIHNMGQVAQTYVRRVVRERPNGDTMTTLRKEYFERFGDQI